MINVLWNKIKNYMDKNSYTYTFEKGYYSVDIEIDDMEIILFYNDFFFIDNVRIDGENQNDTFEKIKLFIDLIKNPSEEIQLKTVKLNGLVIEHIKNPSEKVQFAAVRENRYSIEHIENPSEDVQLELVKNDDGSDYPIIKFIQNPSEKVQLTAVRKNGRSIRYIQNPSEKVQLEAVRKNGCSIRYIQNPSEKVQLEAVKQNGCSIQYIKNPSEKVQLEAVRKNGCSIIYIQNPSKNIRKQVQISIIRDICGVNINDNISKEELNRLQLEVVKKKPTLIKYLINPSIKTKLMSIIQRISRF